MLKSSLYKKIASIVVIVGEIYCKKPMVENFNLTAAILNVISGKTVTQPESAKRNPVLPKPKCPVALFCIIKI